MVEHRSAKRRRISNDGRDQRQDVEIPETPPSTDVDGAYPAAMDVDDSELDVVRPGTPSKSSRRQSTGAASTTENNHVKDEDTQSQSVRASSRRRKAPTRYEDELETIETPRRSRLSTTTPSKTTVSGSGARKGKKKTQADDGESQKCPAVVVKAISSRNKRRNSTKDIVQSHSDASPESESQPPEVESTLVDDGLDDKYDPVAVQLQEMLQPQDEVHEEINQPMALPEYAERFKNLCESEFRHEIVDLSKLILEKVTGKRFSPLKGLDAEYQKVYQLVEQTVTAGEGNSMLVMGSRGSGKTSMVESIIASLLKQHGDDFHVVRLNGFFHTDDRLSLREIWRQLGREMETEDDASKINSYADTMATLLALLSHPEELSQGTDRSNGLTTAKSVVIILDEFDLFATHPRQTLLYNLFDIAQARKAPLAVLGLTTKVDVTETLEKRVKSRFSHRYVYLPLARSFEAFSDACLSPLMVEMHEAESHDFAHKNPKKAQQLLMAWQEYLKGLWQDKDFEIHLQRLYYQTKSVKDFLSSALLPLSDFHRSLLDVDSDSAADLNVPTPRDFAAQSLTCPDPAPLPFPVTMTGSTSATSLPLSLLLAATRLTALYDRSSDAAGSQSLALSFPAAYTEYVRLLTAAKATAAAQGASATGGRVWGRDVSREAWEKLVNWGLVLPLGSGNGTTDGTMFKVEVSYEEVADMVGGGGGSLGKWWRD